MTRNLRLLTYIALFVSTLVIGAHALYTTSILHRPAWNYDGSHTLIKFTLAYFTIATVIAAIARRYLRLAFAIAVTFTVSAVAISPLVAVCIVITSAYLVGDLLIRRTSLLLAETDLRFPISIFAGLAVYIAVISVLAQVKLNYPFTYAILFSAPLLLNPRGVLDIISLIRIKLGPTDGTRRLSVYKVLISYFIYIYLIACLLPETGYDALSMHLVVPAYVFDEHLWHFDVNKSIWAVIPMGSDWAYTAAYFFGGEIGARLLNFGFMLLLAYLLFAALKPKVSEPAAFASVLVFVSLPLTYLETTSLFTENLWAGFLFAALLLLLRYGTTGRRGDVILFSACCGAAFATKFTTITAFPALLLFAALYMRRHEPYASAFKMLGAAFVVFMFFAISPYLSAYIHTGNPVFPFFNALFKSPYFPSDTSFNNPLFNHPLTFRTLYDATFDSSKYLEASPGALGLHLFFLIPLSIAATLFSRRTLPIASLILAVSMVWIVFTKQSYLRYIYPTIPLFLTMVAFTIHDVRGQFLWFGRTLTAFIVLAALVNAYLLPSAGWHNRGFSFGAIFDSDRREHFIETHAPIRKAIGYLNSAAGSSARVALFTAPLVAQLKGRAFTNSWHSYEFQRDFIQNAPYTPSALYRLMRNYGITHVIVDRSTDASIKNALEKYGTLEFEVEDTEVLRMPSRPEDMVELLANPGFSDGIDGWSMNGLVTYDSDIHAVRVNVENNLTQTIPIRPGVRYLLSVSAECRPEYNASFRLQINWLDGSHRFLRASVTAKPCTDDFHPTTIRVVAPDNAALAQVYATGHTSTYVRINEVSLKQ